jgi:Secretion system C-terminal sorting domain
MKYLITTLLFLLVFNATAQINCFSNIPVQVIVSTGFEGDSNLKFVYQIDTTNYNNIWQIGKVTKQGFDSAFSGKHAMQTDTLNAYPTNDTSAFYIWILPNNVSMYHQTFSITWMQKYNMSNMLDSGIIQYSLDSGSSWQNVNGFDGLLQPLPVQILFNGNSKIKGNQIFFTDSSKGWEKATICVTFIKYKKPIANKFGFRFMLKTDSIADNKPGWMLDNFKIYTPSYLSSNKNLELHHINILPNPCSSYIIIHNNNINNMRIYNMQGLVVQQIIVPKNELQFRIDVSNLPIGMYYLDAVIDGIHKGEKFSKQ